jgi:hypothetical protein
MNIKWKLCILSSNFDYLENFTFDIEFVKYFADKSCKQK